MARLLYLEASPRGDRSFSSRTAQAFLDVYRATNPDDTIEHVPLFEAALPDFDAEAAAQKMAQIDSLIATGKSIEPTGKWAAVIAEIERLRGADKVLVSSPMWNYSIPYRLKQYIDIVVQPGLSFYVNRKGEYVGMLKGKPLQLVLASGSAYAMRFPAGDDGTKTDFQRAYLEHMFRFIGFADIRVLKIQPTADATRAEAQATLERCIEEARVAAAAF